MRCGAPAPHSRLLGGGLRWCPLPAAPAGPRAVPAALVGGAGLGVATGITAEDARQPLAARVGAEEAGEEGAEGALEAARAPRRAGTSRTTPS